MSERNLIGVWMNSISTNLHSFAEHGRYRTVVEVVYKINERPPQEMHLSCPLEVLQRNMPYQKLENIMKNSDGDIAAMSIPSKAYKQMQRIVNREVDKVLADMAISVIVRIIEELDSGAENIFFIENQNNHKLLERLGYMYLDNVQNTFCMVTYKTSGLLTDTMRTGSQILEFDIDYFKTHNKDYSEIVPNDYRESLLQTVLYRMKTQDVALPPLRCDIFSQGISNKDIQDKVKTVYTVLSDRKNMSLPIQEGSEYKSFVMIPNVLYQCMEYAEQFRGILERILEGIDDDVNRQDIR